MTGSEQPDIVERLRSPDTIGLFDPYHEDHGRAVMEAAANEIEKLRAELKLTEIARQAEEQGSHED